MFDIDWIAEHWTLNTVFKNNKNHHGIMGSKSDEFKKDRAENFHQSVCSTRRRGKKTPIMSRLNSSANFEENL